MHYTSFRFICHHTCKSPLPPSPQGNTDRSSVLNFTFVKEDGVKEELGKASVKLFNYRNVVCMIIRVVT